MGKVRNSIGKGLLPDDAEFIECVAPYRWTKLLKRIESALTTNPVEKGATHIMARRTVPFLPNNYYHVYNRGANKADIFRSDQEYLFLLKQIKDHLREFAISVIAYCLMSNHYHLILRQNGEAKINDFMQAVFYNYSMSFNQIHGHSGTLFEGPFRAILVGKNEYLLHLCRYIHRNPLEAGIVARPEEWRYSNYAEFVSKRKGTLVDHEFVTVNFGSPEAYEEFVMNYTPPEKTQRELRHYLFWD